MKKNKRMNFKLKLIIIETTMKKRKKINQQKNFQNYQFLRNYNKDIDELFFPSDLSSLYPIAKSLLESIDQRTETGFVLMEDMNDELVKRF